MKDFDVRKYSINLKRDGLKAPKTERSNRAIVTIKKFIEKNTRAKSADILIGEELNEALWNKGIKNPPSKVNIFVQKLKSGKVFVNLEGKALRVEKEKKEEKADKEKKLEDIASEKEPKAEELKPAEKVEKE